MGLINKRTRVKVGGNRIVIRPIKVNLGKVYIRYGCLVVTRARRRRRVDARVTIHNYYFGNINEGTPLPSRIDMILHDQISTIAARRTALAQYIVFIGNKSTGLPVKGVFCRVEISSGGENQTYTFRKGSVPSNFSPPGSI